MRQIVLDTETTGLDFTKGDKIIEVACVELINHIPTGNIYQEYLNPEKEISEEAEKIHGLTSDFLKQKPPFKKIVPSFLKFIKKEFLINNQNKNSFNLIFNQIEKEVTILNDNQRIIKIFGKISNTSNIESYKIPKLQGTLIDSKNNIITTWFFNAEQDNLGPQESLNFNTSYIHNSQDIADIKIEFYKEEK